MFPDAPYMPANRRVTVSLLKESPPTPMVKGGSLGGLCPEHPSRHFHISPYFAGFNIVFSHELDKHTAYSLDSASVFETTPSAPGNWNSAMSQFTNDLVAACLAELEIFQDGEQKEWMDDAYLVVGKYWDKLAEIPQYKNWKGYNGRSDIKLSPKGVPLKNGNRNQPWSAAFISYVMAEAGAGDSFLYAPSHSVYIVRALREAAKAHSTAAFIARRHPDYVPKIGDLIACERQPAINPNFDTYIDYVKDKKYEAHCDVIVDIQNNKLITVGGNVSNSVRTKQWPLKNGKIGNFDPFSATAGVICVIECRL